MDEIQRYHEQLLYPVVRIYSNKAAGSGTVIYSGKDPKNDDEYINLILTNHHVVESLISQKNEWDSVLKRKIDKEVFDHAHVEIFDYIKMSTVNSTNRYRAEIVAYDQDHDLAVLRVLSPKKLDYVATLLAKDKIGNLRLFDRVATSGCSLAHEPFVTFGEITFLNEIIEQKKYTMTSCSSIFGNSGGALFLASTGELIGVPSRVTAIQLGFGVDVVTWMNFAAAPERLYEFFDDQELRFIYDPSDNYYSAIERRKMKQKQALLDLKAEMVRDSE